MKKTFPILVGLFLAAWLVQILAMAAVGYARGSAMAYAYQSPDSDEYVSLARGLAWQGRFLRIDHNGQPRVAWPDTWRTPGYPAVLAAWIRVFGDRTCGLLLFHQFLTAASVPLLWLILRRYCSPRWAMIGALAWCLDPFRIYYSLWFLAETLFTLALLVCIYAWSVLSERGWTLGRAALIGLLAGALVLIRPIALPLPILACVGLLLTRRCSGRPPWRPSGAACGTDPVARDGAKRAAFGTRLGLVLACALATTVVVGPWALRNRIAAGHWALTSQTGASLAYHKVADVLLRAQGRSAYRFNTEALDEVRNEIDRHLREEWELTLGPLDATQSADLRFDTLNFGLTSSVDPFEASNLLQQISTELLKQHKRPAISCFVKQGASMLVFPLGMALWPPVGTGPLSLLGGGSPLARVVAGGIGLFYAALVLAVVLRIAIATVGWLSRLISHRSPTSPATPRSAVASEEVRHDAEHSALSTQHSALSTQHSVLSTFFVLWPALALFVLSLPSEDPRFRLPLIPLFWLMALGRRRTPFWNAAAATPL